MTHVLPWSDHSTQMSRLLEWKGLNATDPRFQPSPSSTIDMSWQESRELLNILLEPAPRPRQGPKIYVEWGAGGSTELIAFLALSGLIKGGIRAYSIESGLGWMQIMRQRSTLVSAAEHAGHLKFVHGDIGPTAHLGYPARGWNSSDTARTIRYVGLKQLGEPAFDVVLDDGRFRVACALETLSYLRRGSIVMLHDFAVRNRGASAERVALYTNGLVRPGFYSIVRKNETLGVLTPGPEASNESAVADAMQRALRIPQ